MKNHVTPAGPIQILPGTSDESIRKETLGIDQSEDISLEFQKLCEKSLPRIISTERNGHLRDG